MELTPRPQATPEPASSAKRAVIRTLVAIALVMGGIFAYGFVHGFMKVMNEKRTLDAADRAPLVADAEGRLHHPTLGFSIAKPPASFHENAELAAAALAKSPPDSDAFYAYTETPPRVVFMTSVSANLGGSRHDLEEFMAGIRSSYDHPGPKPTYVTDELVGDDGHLEGRLHVVRSNGLHMQTRIYTMHVAGYAPAIVTLLLIGPDATTNVDLLSSFRP